MTIYTARQIRDFWKWIDKSGDCWLYTGYSVVNGYGRKGIGKRVVMCHHIAWELAYGDIPDGMFVRHRCGNTLCVNPEHLFLAMSARGK